MTMLNSGGRMRHVFLPLDNDDGPDDGPALDACIDIAVRLAQSVGGRLTVIRQSGLDMPNGDQPGAVVPRRAGVSAAHGAVIDRPDVALRLLEARDAFDTACRLAAADHGIVVMLDRQEVEVATALIDHGLPVLAVPRLATSLDPAGEALVLWDGSRSAAHALIAALPLLENARRVTILEIDDGSLRRPAGKAIALLSQHGVSGHVQHDLAFGEKAGIVLLDRIAEIRPAYAVMGGFGHPRWIESAIGGVTRRLLAECDVPLFLKH